MTLLTAHEAEHHEPVGSDHSDDGPWVDATSGQKFRLYRTAQPTETLRVPEMPAWSLVAIGRLVDSVQGPEWNGPGSLPTELGLVRRAFAIICELMPDARVEYVPQVVPLVDGGIQLEWHRDELDLEIALTPDGDVYVAHARTNGVDSWDGDYRDLRDATHKALLKASQGL